MSLRSRLQTWWRATAHRHMTAAQIDEELRFHIECYSQDLVRSGVPRGEALRRAKAQLGSQAAVRENARHAWGVRALDELAADLRYGLRMLRKNLGLTAIAIASLGLGIGANTAIFSMINALLLDAIPVSHPEQMRLLEWRAQHLPSYKNLPMRDLYGPVNLTKTGVAIGPEFSFPQYVALAQDHAVFQGLAAYFHAGGAAVATGNNLQNGTLEYVSPNFFEVLGVRAAAGRVISPYDGAQGGAPVAVLSDWLWRDLFARSPAAIGSTIEVNRVPLIIVGIAPQGFHGPDVDIDPGLYLPLAMFPEVSPGSYEHGKNRLADGDAWWIRIIGRIRPGISDAQAATALDRAFRETSKATLTSPDRFDQASVRLAVSVGGRGDAQTTDREFVPVALGLSALAALVLLLACVNLANLLLARAISRRRELSVRMALGAPRSRVMRQLMVESMMLAVLGGAAGTALAFAARNVIPRFLQHQPVAFDWKVCAFATGLSLITGIFFGAIPSWRATRGNILRGLRHGAHATRDRSHARLGKTLVVVQIALSMVLLMGTGLFLRTVRNLLHGELGFDPHHILLFGVALPARAYPGPRECAAAFRQIEDRLTALPGVASASFSVDPLIDNDTSTTAFNPVGEPLGQNTAWINVVGDNFFQVMGIPLLAGRELDAQDTATSPLVAVVNQELAHRFFPGRNPIGSTFNSPPIRIVGIVGNTKFSDLRQVPPPTYYLAESQNGRWNQVTFEVKTAGDPATITDEARAAVRGFDSQLPLTNVRTQDEQIDDSIRNERLFAMLAASFGVIALVLACIGVYGIMAYTVSQRTNEIGVRMALGAEPKQVLRMMLSEASSLATLGIVIGAAGALALARFAASMFYGVHAWDSLTLAGAAFLLLSVAVASGFFPARRAARIDPIAALRHE
ncbi:MAG TPA: ABC transporter permease [Terracidiphilus sp.]|nr:ABC transporter permease [Terracidiphilus sp.]